MRNPALTTTIIMALASAGTATPAAAADPVCQALMASQMSLAKVPTHIYLTSEDKFSGANMRKAAGTLGMTGVKKSEEISTGKDVYILQNGRWIDMQTSFAEMAKDGEDDPDTKKIREAERCKTLADDAVAGQPATVYQSHNPESGIDTKVWISKASHLPLKSEITNDGGVMHSFMTSVYDYRNVQAPSGAVSMRQAMQERHGKH